ANLSRYISFTVEKPCAITIVGTPEGRSGRYSGRMSHRQHGWTYCSVCANVKSFYPVESSGTGPNPFNKETPWPAGKNESRCVSLRFDVLCVRVLYKNSNKIEQSTVGR